MSSKIFLQALQSKLKGGNARSIHLNALPGRLATRLDIKQLDLIQSGLSLDFLDLLLTQPSFEFKVSFDTIDLNERSKEEQKRLGIVSKRLNSIIIENEDYFKEHGTKTLGFGYPILIKRSTKDPTKIIKAPIFIWPLDAIKSKTRVNEWSFIRNKVQGNVGLINAEIHSVGMNEVLHSFIKGEDDISLPTFNSEALEDMVIDKDELLTACAQVLSALNSGSISSYLELLEKNFAGAVKALPEPAEIDEIANNKAYIHFGGVLGLFRAQKESIITDISKLLERFDEFEFDNLTVGNLSETPHSAVSTDPAQQAILSTLGSESNQIIQGPPGTGKSQSLTALITNALANGLKCLVVCEKKTALDVIKRNLERTHEPMVQLVAVIDDVNEDREAIVDSVRERQNALPAYQQVEMANTQYVSAMGKLKEVTATINQHHSALAKPIYGGKTWDQLVGKYLSLRKKFASLPLKNDLARQDFKFTGDENELKFLLDILGKGNAYYTEALDAHKPLSILADSLFQTKAVGQVRAEVEEFIENALLKVPKIIELISDIKARFEHWYDTEFQAMPEAVRQAFKTYLPYAIGNATSFTPIQDEFSLEADCKEVIGLLDQLEKDAIQLKLEYVECLRVHYESYRSEVKKEISNYLSFVEDNLDEHGSFFFANTGLAKFKTTFFAVFSDKYKRLKIARSKHLGKVAGVRVSHEAKTYIAHDHLKSIDGADYAVYYDNIRALDQKVKDWELQIPRTIDVYADNLQPTHCHSALIEFSQRSKEFLIRFSEITSDLRTKHGLLPENEISEINKLINEVPMVISILKQHLSLFDNLRNLHEARALEYEGVAEALSDIYMPNGIHILNTTSYGYQGLDQALEKAKQCANQALIVQANMSNFRSYFQWRTFFLGCDIGQQKLVGTIANALSGSWSEGFECWYLFWLLSLNEPDHLPKGDYDIHQYKKFKQEFDYRQLNKIMAKWMERQVGSVRVFKAKKQSINSLFNKKGGKGMRRNSLRNIIRSEFEMFTDFFPVVLLNPSVCSSIIPLNEGIFDLVIFDEASQLRLEDTYPSLIRGKAKIVSGDKHQMAPSSYFEGSGALLDPFDGESEDEDDEPNVELAAQKSEQALAESESLLAFAVDKNFKESYLTVHYRSRHPYLIDFSNYAFYGKRLIPVPAQKEYVPIEFMQVNGIYENQTNKAEALQVVSILRHHIKANFKGQYPSVGVATFNIYQRNLILEEIGVARRESIEFDTIMGAIGDSFFVKNLENIQGDERDIVIISTTFGRKPNGTFSQSFGPIIQSKGHRMLNVIITRAKDKVFICNSFPEENINQYAQLIQEKGNKGRAILYAYLNYARAVSEGNDEQRVNILNLISQYCTDQYYDRNDPGLGSESPFEEEVFVRLSQHIDVERIEQQCKVGGFRIDMVIHPKSGFGKRIAIECDGAKYHSSPEAYAWDVFRQEQLEGFGFVFHRIWSTNWWDSVDQELENLLQFIRDVDSGKYPEEQRSLFD